MILSKTNHPDSAGLQVSYCQDERLSWDSRGLLAYLLNHPKQETSIGALVEISPKTGKTKIGRMLNELKSLGYLKVSQGRNTLGRLTKSTYEAFPTTENNCQGN